MFGFSKSKIGGVAAMLGATAGVLHDVAYSQLTFEKVSTYVSTFALGLAAFGIRVAIGNLNVGNMAATVNTQASLPPSERRGPLA